MKLNNIRIVLVSTSHPGNIGSSARAMKTMGLSHLYLVNPKLFPDKVANSMCAGSDDLLDVAVVVDSLQEALVGTKLVLGTSARSRDLELSLQNPREAGDFIARQSDDTDVAIVFGREHAGLTNDELMLCHRHIHIPTTPDYSSLNLSQAVQIMAYECRMHLLARPKVVSNSNDDWASHDDVERVYEHLQQVMVDIDFLNPDKPGRLMQRLRRLFNRAHLEKQEVNILRGILTQVSINAVKPSAKSD